MSDNREEIYNEENFKEKYPELYKLVKSHFVNYKFEDFCFVQCLIKFGFIEISYALKTNEDFTYFFECKVGEESNGEYEFSGD